LIDNPVMAVMTTKSPLFKNYWTKWLVWKQISSRTLLVEQRSSPFER